LLYWIFQEVGVCMACYEIAAWYRCCWRDWRTSRLIRRDYTVHRRRSRHRRDHTPVPPRRTAGRPPATPSRRGRHAADPRPATEEEREPWRHLPRRSMSGRRQAECRRLRYSFVVISVRTVLGVTARRASASTQRYTARFCLSAARLDLFSTSSVCEIDFNFAEIIVWFVMPNTAYS